MRPALLVIALAACGDDDAEPRLLAGSPEATRALGFAADGTPVAIGGPSTFGLARLQVQTGETWTEVAGVAGFDARAQLTGGRDRPLSAISQSTLAYRAGAAITDAWTAIAIPAGATPGTLFGGDAEGRIYGLDLADGDGNGAVVRWRPGDARWEEVAGTRPVDAGVTELVVDAAGRVVWIAPGVGVVRVADGTRELIVDCPDCPLATPTVDDEGTLTVLACPTVLRRSTAGELATVPLPAGHVACAGLDTTPDGTSLLASFGGDGDGALSILPPGASGWERIAAASPGLRYRLRDARTAYAFGDGTIGRGIYVIAF